MPDMTDKQNAIEILRAEHEQMREMFTIIAATEEPELKRKLLHELICIVKIHAELEQNYFYPFISRHVRYEHMKRPAQEFHSVEVLLSDVQGAADQEFAAMLAQVADCLEKHIFDAEELLFMKIEQRCSDVTYSLSQLSARMIAKKKELHRKLGTAKKAS